MKTLLHAYRRAFNMAEEVPMTTIVFHMVTVLSFVFILGFTYSQVLIFFSHIPVG